MTAKLPKNINEFMEWPWERIEPYFQELMDREINIVNVNQYLSDWSKIDEYITESFNRLYVRTTVDTTDKDAEQKFNYFLDEIYPNAELKNQNLKDKLLASGLKPEGFEIPLRNMEADAEIFREKNIVIQSQDYKLSTEYDKLVGAQTVTWEGKELTIEQMKPIYQLTDREIREKAWKLAAKRQLQDRDSYNNLWKKFLDLRIEMAHNAEFPDYRAYRWKQLHRFDYTPAEAKQFDLAIEEVIVPIAESFYNKRKQRLGVDKLRPWDLNVDTLKREPLKPFTKADDLERKTLSIFNNVDPQLGEYFEIMRKENLLDLDNRKGKAPGGYCTDFTSIRRPFIFMNAVGIHDDVQTLLHEGGHAFHVFETAQLPYIQQLDVGMEFAEVASMAMELLSAPYLTTGYGGFYTQDEAARARIEHLETSLLFWPYMAVVDSFQHWVYENPNDSRHPSNCDHKWGELWDRYMVGVDWSGIEDEKLTGWHRKLHIFQVPFYYVEYGMAQVGANQIWQNALQDQARTVLNYRKALALGGTVSLPELYKAAGAKFKFDTVTLEQVCGLMVTTIEELEKQLD